MRTTTTTAPVVLDATAIDLLPTVPLEQIGHGVSHRVLWEGAHGVAGLLHLDARSCIDPHAHEHAAHDMWIVEGSCDTLGRHLLARSYVHVPEGVDHDIVAGPDGCTLLYFYRTAGTDQEDEPCE